VYDNELNMTRLCEVLIFVLNRTTVGQDSRDFEIIVKHFSKPLFLDRMDRGVNHNFNLN
jgi:hypothetical protein